MFGDEKGSLDALLHRSPPSWLQLFFASPFKTTAKTLYGYRSRYRATKPENAITVVCISDTHNRFPEIPDGDLLIHAGDLSQGGTRQEIQRTLDWLQKLPHQHKVVIAGNHELLLDPKKGLADADRRSLDWHDLIYLQDSSISLRFRGGRVLTVYGSPWTRKHGNWAFEYPASAADHWSNTVPDATDILITHMPPFAHLDLDGLGDDHLLREIRRAKPALHVFGHIHAGRGTDELRHGRDSLERSYEAVMRRRAGLPAILHMVFCLLWERVRGGSQSQSQSQSRSSHHRTVLVNAAVVGGPRDTEVRDPITVQI